MIVVVVAVVVVVVVAVVFVDVAKVVAVVFVFVTVAVVVIGVIVVVVVVVNEVSVLMRHSETPSFLAILSIHPHASRCKHLIHTPIHHSHPGRPFEGR